MPVARFVSLSVSLVVVWSIVAATALHAEPILLPERKPVVAPGNKPATVDDKKILDGADKKKAHKPPTHGAVLLFETATGRILHHHRIDRQTFPASLTKMMTAYITFEAVKEGRATQTFTLESKLKISDYARSQPATRVGLRKGIDVTIDQAVRSLIIRSANDFAVALAETISGSEAAFIDRMNATARRLGMSRTNFTNPHGLPNPHQVSTARDMALLTAALIRDFPKHADVFSSEEVKIRNLTLRSHNSLLRTYEGTDGMKTGFTCASGYNIVASATRGGRRLAVVVIGALRRPEREKRARAMLDLGFAMLSGVEPMPENATLASVPITGRDSDDTLDLSHKTRTWACGNSPKPRKKRNRRKKKKKKSASITGKKKAKALGGL